ncbi:MAG: TonB-dependent receptor [Myxococcales bacterium]
MKSFLRRTTLAFALGAGVLGASLSARAEDADEHAPDDLDLVRLLSTEVSTASKTSESIDDAPAVITVVTYEDIVRWGYQSVAEVLQNTLGFYVLDDHVLPNVGVRGVTGGAGAESGVLKVMIDGRSVSYRSTSGNWLGVELVPLESIKQIEILRGPASALYGADAFLGVVNIITKPPDAVRPVRARMLGGYTGDHPGGQVDVVGGGKWGKFDLMLGAVAEAKDRSGLKLPKDSPGTTVPADVNRRSSRDLSRRSLGLQSRLGYRVDGVGHVVLSAYASGIERGGDFAPWAQLSDGRAPDGSARGTTIALGQYRVNLDTLVQANKSLDFALQSTYFEGGVLPPDRVEIGSDQFYVERKQHYRGADSMLEARYHPIDSLSVVLGTEVLVDHERLPDPRRVDRVTGDSAAISPATRNEITFTNVGTYFSANYQAIPRWLKLTGGGRYDRHSKYGDVFSGRVGAISHWLSSLTVKLLYGSAFKAPSPYLLYAVPLRPGDVIGNGSLRPQYIHTVEGQVAYRPSKMFEASTGLSQNWLVDKAEFTPQGINQAALNVASQSTLSWESRADLRYRDYFTSYAGFDLVRSRRELGQEGYAATLIGSQNVVYPTWIARGGVSVLLPFVPSFPVDFTAQGMVVGARRAGDASIVEHGSSYTLPTYAMLNLSLATRELYLIRGHESRIALRARNVLGAGGPDPGFYGYDIPLAPREVFLEFRHVY